MITKNGDVPPSKTLAQLFAAVPARRLRGAVASTSKFVRLLRRSFSRVCLCVTGRSNGSKVGPARCPGGAPEAGISGERTREYRGRPPGENAAVAEALSRGHRRRVSSVPSGEFECDGRIEDMCSFFRCV